MLFPVCVTSRFTNAKFTSVILLTKQHNGNGKTEIINEEKAEQSCWDYFGEKKAYRDYFCIHHNYRCYVAMNCVACMCQSFLLTDYI